MFRVNFYPPPRPGSRTILILSPGGAGMAAADRLLRETVAVPNRYSQSGRLDRVRSCGFAAKYLSVVRQLRIDSSFLTILEPFGEEDFSKYSKASAEELTLFINL